MYQYDLNSTLKQIGIGLLLLILVYPMSATAQDLRLECARRDSLDVHPLETGKDVTSFLALLKAGNKFGLYPSPETLEKAHKIASEVGQRSERVALAKALLFFQDIELSKLASYAMIVSNGISLLPDEEKSEALNVIGNISSMSGDHISALAYYQRSFDSADSSRPIDRIYPLGNLALSYLANQDTATAVEIIHRSNRLVSKLDNPEEVAYNNVYDYTGLGDIHLAQGRRDSADFFFQLAANSASIFKPGHKRFTEMQTVLLPSLIRFHTKEKNSAFALKFIDSLDSQWPELALLLEAEYYQSVGEFSKAFALTGTPIQKDLALDKKRIELRRTLASSLGLHKIAEEAIDQLLTISEENLARSKKELVSISKAQMEASEKERQADVNRYKNKLELLETRQRNWIASALILLSLGIAIWFNQRYKKSQKRSLNLSKIVTQHEADLIEANKQLASKVRSMERFNHLLSHDLREPLRSISGFTSILMRKAKPYTELNGDFNLLSKGVEQLASLMTGVEHLRRVEEKRVTPSKVDVQEVVTDIIKDVKSKYKSTSADITIRGNFDPIYADKNLFYKALLELVDNAVKFSSGEKAYVTIEATQQDDTLSVYVQDYGIGMDTAFSEQIFGIFKRLNRRENFVGSGVGLAIAKLACDKCNGSISLLESKEGLGTTFLLSLPIASDRLKQHEHKKLSAIA